MTILADRMSKASGTTREPEPPPDLPNVDEALRYYIYGPALRTPPDVTFGAQWHSALRPVAQRPWDQLINSVADGLGRLQGLKPGWDGRRGKPITSAALRGMLDILGMLLVDGSEPPQISPLPSGGIHVGWLASGDEIEIEIDNTGSAQVLAETASGDVIAEGPLEAAQPSARVSDVAAFLQDISARIAAHRRRA